VSPLALSATVATGPSACSASAPFEITRDLQLPTAIVTATQPTSLAFLVISPRIVPFTLLCAHASAWKTPISSAHYPHNEHMARVADELGLMVWD
jgi:hypothetical protein